MSGLFGWGLTPAALVGAIMLDYILPFTFLGIAGIFRKKGYLGVCAGVIIAVALRFICHFLSGAIIFDIWCEWDSVWLYSLCYNGSFMLPELIFTVVGVAIIFAIPEINKLKAKIDQLGYEDELEKVIHPESLAVSYTKTGKRIKRTNLNDKEKGDLADLERQLLAEEKRLASFKALDMDAIRGLEKSQKERNDEREALVNANKQELKNARDAMAKFDKEVADSQMSDFARGEKAIADKKLAYLDYYKKVTEAEEKQRQKALANGDKTAADKHLANIFAYQNAAGKIYIWEKQQIAELEKKRAEAWKPHETFGKDFKKEQKEALAAENLERKLSKLQSKGNRAGALQMVKQEYLRLKTVLANLDTSRQKMLQDFKSGTSEDGAGLGKEEGRKLTATENEMKAVDSRMAQLRKMFYDIKEQTDKKSLEMKASSIGSWSAANLSRARGSSNPAERTARATEEMVKQQKKTNDKLDKNKITW
jgi:hypothetical protein